MLLLLSFLPSRTFVVQASISCPAPLVIPDDPKTPRRIQNTHCAPPCPSFIFSRTEYVVNSNMFMGVSTVSLFVSIFLFLTYSTFVDKRKSVYVISFLAMILLVSITIFIGAAVAHSENNPDGISGALCRSNSEEMMQPYNDACTVQAALIQFAFLGLCCWWCISAVDLFIKIVVEW